MRTREGREGTENSDKRKRRREREHKENKRRSIEGGYSMGEFALGELKIKKSKLV